MSEPEFCPETAPSGALCGVAYRLVHSRHFALDGSVWDTEQPHRPHRVSAADWLWDELGLDPRRVSRDTFNGLINEYMARRQREIFAPTPVLTPASPYAADPGPGDMLVLRPCLCCGCRDSTVCFHGGEQTGCMWTGPGR